ncbi:MAG: DUF2911 domain-containing protein [Bacteroidetes bacterium]|nr:DUF2911 domain-containing protein [Bacteroidota bacterium]
MHSYTKLLLAAVAVVSLGLLASSDATAQERLASPRGEAATQIDGKWIAIDYGRPILRGRRGIFGSGDSYGEKVLAGAPVWRLGANQSTRLNTEVALHFGDKMLPAGEYSLFAALSQTGWTLIVSNHQAQVNYGDGSPGIWGAYGYSPDKDVIRVPMTVSKLDNSVDELTIGFLDVTASGGVLAVWWDDQMATAPFKVGSDM